LEYIINTPSFGQTNVADLDQQIKSLRQTNNVDLEEISIYNATILVETSIANDIQKQKSKLEKELS
jgi:hypothetical protein